MKKFPSPPAPANINSNGVTSISYKWYFFLLAVFDLAWVFVEFCRAFLITIYSCLVESLLHHLF